MSNIPQVIQPSYDQFAEMLAESSVVPLASRFVFDTVTPLAVLSAFPEEDFVCLLESLGETREASRYTILGLDPRAVFSFDGVQVTETWTGEEPMVTSAKGVVRQLDDFLRSFHSVHDDTMPLSNGGLIGYVSRDLLGDAQAQGKSELPLAHFIVPQTFLVFDAKERHMTLLVNAFSHDGDEPQAAFDKAKARLDAHKERILSFSPPAYKPIYSGLVPSRTTDEPDHILKELAMKLSAEATKAEVSQLYLSHELRSPTTAHPLDVYRVFRTVYPSEYSYLFRMNGTYYIGSHEKAVSPPRLSFANLLRNVMASAQFSGLPNEAALAFRRKKELRHQHATAAFGYVGFNGIYELTHGNKEVVLVKREDGSHEAIFSQAANVHWEGLYSAKGPTMRMSNADSVAACIREILKAAETLSSPQ